MAEFLFSLSPPHSRRRESIAPEAADGVHTDLHISILPKSFWNGELNCAPYQAVADAVTIGFVRAHVNSSVIALREEIATQLADDKNLPNSYIFLKGVGRALVPIRPKQETLLTIDNFKSIGSRMPPEIVLLDASSLSQAHSQRLHMGSKTHLLPRRSRDIIHHDNDSSSLENASDLRDRVNKGVRDRMQNRAKPNPSKIQAPPPRIQMNPGMKRGNTHDGAASVDSTPRELGRYRKPNDGKRDGAGSRVSTNGSVDSRIIGNDSQLENELRLSSQIRNYEINNYYLHGASDFGMKSLNQPLVHTKSSAPAGQKRKNSVRFPPVTDLEQHNYMTDEREPDYDTNGTPRNYPLPQKSQKPRQIQHGKTSKGGQVPRRVEQIGHSTDSEDELPPLRGSVQSNYSAPEKVTKTRKSLAKPIRASGAANGDGDKRIAGNWIKYF